MRKTTLAVVLAFLYMATLGALPSVISLSLMIAAAGVGLVCYLGFGSRKGTPFIMSCLAAAVSVGAMSSVITFVNGLETMRSLQLTIRLLGPLAMFLIGFCAGRAGSADKVYGGAVLVAISQAIFAIGSIVIGVAPTIGGVVRPDGFLTPNVVANSAMLGAVVAFVLFMDPAARRTKCATLSGLAFVLLLSFLVVSATLKNIIALLPALSVAFYRLTGSQRVLKAGIACALVAPVALLMVALSPAGERIMDLYERGTLGGDGQSSFEWRLRHWEMLLGDWWRNYRYTGSGLGQSVNMEGVRFFYGEGAVAHNDWVAILVELGPILGVTLISMFAIVLRRVYLRSIGDSRGRAILVASLVALAVAMAGGNVMFTISFLYLFWMLVGAVYGNCLYGRKRVSDACEVAGWRSMGGLR